MNYEIRTVYSKEDIEGFCEAYSARNKLSRTFRKFNKVATTIFAVVQWGIALLLLIASIVLKFSLKSEGFFIFAVIIFMGLVIFYSGRRSSFESKIAWKAYPYKGEQIVFNFLPGGFFILERNSETEVRYEGLVRVYEDDKRFYLFNTPRNAFILPKRDFKIDIDEFRNFITSVVQLQVEHS